MATNREWHQANRMPPRATFDQRVEWHIAHAAHCTCRPAPELVRAEIARRGVALTGRPDQA